MLGAPDRRILFICTVEWRQADGHVANLERLATGPRTGEILALPVEVPGTGRPWQQTGRPGPVPPQHFLYRSSQSTAALPRSISLSIRELAAPGGETPVRSVGACL